MTEEQVKQIVANMISSGELEIRVGSNSEPFLKQSRLSVNIFHNKEDGYRKKLLEKVVRV